jgi:hypothetical protein
MGNEENTPKTTENTMNYAWIKLPRSVWETGRCWEVKPMPEILAIIDMIMLANSQKTQILFEKEPIEIGKHQFLRSIMFLAERWGWDRKKVKTFLADYDITYTTIGSRGKEASIFDISNLFFVKIMQKNVQKFPMYAYKNSPPESIENIDLTVGDNTEIPQGDLQKFPTNKNRYNNTIDAGASVGENFYDWHEWKLKVGLVNVYVKRLDKMAAGDPSFCAKILKDHGIVLVLAKLEQIITSEVVFNDSKHARQYVVASLKKAAVGQLQSNGASTYGRKKEESINSILDDEFQFPRLNDILKERE